jgi:hypothetical protein
MEPVILKVHSIRTLQDADQTDVLQDLSPAFLELRERMEARIADLAAVRAARHPAASAPSTTGGPPETRPTDNAVILDAMEVIKQFMAQQQHLMILSGIGAASTPLPLGAACAVPQAQIQTELRYSLPSLGMHRALPGPFQHSMNPDMPVNVGDAPEMLPDPVVTSQPNAGTGPDIDDAEGNVSGGWSSGSARALVADGADCAPLRDSSE